MSYNRPAPSLAGYGTRQGQAGWIETRCLLGVGHCSKGFTGIISPKFHNNFMRGVLLLTVFYS